ncbi:MAG: PqqD family protein [bacterium]|nr:PqqD family protein [bacterium]
MRMPAPLSLGAMPCRCAKWYERDERVVIQRIRPASFSTVAGLREWIRYFLMPSRLRLDEMGSHVWRRMDGETSLAQIIDAVRTNDCEDLERRVEIFVRALVGQGLAGEGSHRASGEEYSGNCLGQDFDVDPQ